MPRSIIGKRLFYINIIRKTLTQLALGLNLADWRGGCTPNSMCSSLARPIVSVHQSVYLSIYLCFLLRFRIQIQLLMCVSVCMLIGQCFKLSSTVRNCYISSELIILRWIECCQSAWVRLSWSRLKSGLLWTVCLLQSCTMSLRLFLNVKIKIKRSSKEDQEDENEDEDEDHGQDLGEYSPMPARPPHGWCLQLITS